MEIKANWLDEVSFNHDGLVPAVAQDHVTGRILMMAWMNKKTLAQTVETGKATYWSRSRQEVWRKGESSGNEQLVKSVHLDCDADVIILQVEQTINIACTPAGSAQNFDENGWQVTEPVLKEPSEIYAND